MEVHILVMQLHLQKTWHQFLYAPQLFLHTGKNCMDAGSSFVLKLREKSLLGSLMILSFH